VIDVNLGGTFNTTQAFFDDLKSANAGRLINISSVIGKQGNYGQVNYAASKSGLFGMTRSLALELAGHDATANVVAPGYTKTDMILSVREDIKDRIREKIPLDRFAEISEIACVVRFLASKDASYVTGEIIDVNGAMDL
jgi:3-oxoacyl-[acyl-carrier protein] reductase